MGARAFLAGSILALPLAACSAEPDPADAMEREAGELVQPRPGQYTSTVELVEYAVPGASPRDADLLREQMGGLGPQVRSYCLTEAEAARGFEEVMRGAQDGDCRFADFAADRHTMRAEMTCNGPLPGAASAVTIEGSGYEDRSDLALTIEQRGAPVPGGVVRMRFKVANRRTGPCA